ncbi:MAG: S1C family serine protease [Acidimicrobiia bacterium]|nr:S1C family serine protease [Acidimicrobiia bacterium]
MLDQLEAAAAAVHAAASPAVVGIGRDGRGSGIVIADDLVATNAHNLRDATTTITGADGRRIPAQVVAADVDGDLAVVRAEGVRAAAWRWRDEPAGVGMPVFALTAGPGGARLAFGLVAAVDHSFPGPRGRRVRGAIEHGASLPRGASGGPLLDATGALVGINTHRLRGGGYLALPADARLRRQLDRLAAGSAPHRRRLGVALAPTDVAQALRRSVGLAPLDGLLVRDVEPEGPAARAGLAEGDLITSAHGRPVRTVDELAEALDDPGSGAATPDEVALGIVRGVQELTLLARFEAEAPDAPAGENTPATAVPPSDTAPTDDDTTG